MLRSATANVLHPSITLLRPLSTSDEQWAQVRKMNAGGGSSTSIVLGVKPYLLADDDKIRQSFKELRTRDDVAELLEVPSGFLRWILYGKKERRDYIEKLLPKKHGGSRRICIPPPNLRILQDKLLRVLTLSYRPRKCVTGFVRERCTLNNATPHVGKRYVVNFDLADFFPSIHFGRVRGAFTAGPFSVGAQAALTLAQLITHDDGHLPQGAPTSPIVANIVAGPFDTAMMGFAKANRCQYTRYADDITLSTTQRRLPDEISVIGPDGILHLGSELSDLVSTHGFQIRPGKTRVRHSQRRQMATGLVVNEFPNVPRKLMRELRAVIHCCCERGLQAASALYIATHKRAGISDPGSWILHVIRGKLEYIRMIRGEHDPVYRRLLREANMIPGIAIKPESTLENQETQPLRRHSRKNVDWTLWIKKYSSCIFRLKTVSHVDAMEGFGTAFRVGEACFLTAGHNVEERQTNGEPAVYRDVFLDLNLDHLVPLDTFHSIAGEWGAIDLAVAHGTLPASWPLSFVPTQERLPQVGEEVAALGFPDIAAREVTLVMHCGRIESVTTGYRKARFVTVSFASGPALSGAPLLDANGYCVGVMIENTFMDKAKTPARPYGQATAIGHWRSLGAPGNRLTRATG